MPDFNGCWNGCPKQFQRFFDDQFDLDGFFFMFCLAAESKNLFDKIPGPLSSFKDFI
jgi:hypothetical protein